MTDDIGHRALDGHLQQVIALMRASYSWDFFIDIVDRALPKCGHGFQLTFEDMMPKGGEG